MLGFDFFLHGGLLAGLYRESSPFLLPPDQAFMLIPVGYLSFLIGAILVVWLLIRLEIKSWRAGFRFGVTLGALMWGGLALGLLSISTASLALMLGWFLGQTVELGIAGAVAAQGLGMERLGRLWVYVIAFILVAVFVTIMIQNIGMASTA
jgi:hypothetical protein